MMPDSEINLRKKYFNRCKPEEAISAQDPQHWYVDFDAYDLRGERCTDILSSTITLADSPTFQLFTGFNGSGKTSELFRLAQRLEGAGYLVVYSDMLDTADTQSPIDSADVIIALGMAVENRVNDVLRRGGLELWARRFGHEIKELLFSDVILKEFKAKAGYDPVEAEIGLELKANPTFRSALRQAASDRRREFLNQARGFFGDADSKVRTTGFVNGLVIILDNLEKFGIDPTVRDSARRMFLHQADALRAPGVHLIYTLPAALVFSRSGPQLGRLFTGDPLVLPMVKVDDRELGQPYPPGREAMRELLLRRLDMDVVFGGEQELLDLLVAHCGGYARDLLRLTQYAIQVARGLPIAVEHVENAVNRLERSYAQSYSSDDLELFRFIREKRPEKIPEQYQSRLEDVMVGHFVMTYANGRAWHNTHPLISKILDSLTD
jgi:hypothetical protein